jgi:hypothetical protein
MFRDLWYALRASNLDDRDDAIISFKASLAKWLGYLTAIVMALGFYFGGPWKYWSATAFVLFFLVALFNGVFPFDPTRRRDLWKTFLTRAISAVIIITVSIAVFRIIVTLHHFFIWLSK